MKATGIVRRIDDLGRVVIPKEIRKTMRIREGEPLEIFISKDGEVIFKKYSPVLELGQLANNFASTLSKTTGIPCMVCDKDHITSVSGLPRKDFLDKKISKLFEVFLNSKKPFAFGETSESLFPIESQDIRVIAAYPIIANGDVFGCVMFVTQDRLTAPTPIESKLLETAAMVISAQMVD